MKTSGVVLAAAVFAASAAGYTAIANAGPHGGVSAFHNGISSAQFGRFNSVTGTGFSRIPITGGARSTALTGVHRDGVIGSGTQRNGVIGSGSQRNGVIGSGVDGVIGSGSQREGVIARGAEGVIGKH